LPYTYTISLHDALPIWNSYRRNKVLIGCWSLDSVWDFFNRQRPQRVFGNHHFTVRPTLEGKAAGKIAERPHFGGFIRESNDDDLDRKSTRLNSSHQIIS